MTSIVLAFLLFQAPVADPAKVAEERDPAKRAQVVERLFRPFDRSLVGFLVKLAENDPAPAVRRLIVERLGRLPDPAVLEMLERRAVSDADADVSLVALERLREHRARQLGQLFEKRLAVARSGHDAASLETLTAAHQRWMTLARGATLPAFLQEPPPVFEAVPAGKPARVLAFSDYGTGSRDQRKTAAAMLAWHKQHPFDIGITVGDNFPPSGMNGSADPRWQRDWRDLYEPLGIPIFAVFGNHDWGFTDSPAAEILYSLRSRSWRLPALYYSFTAGSIQFFGLCGEALSDTQLKWLDQELGRSRARWKVVYGHEPIYNPGAHGDTPYFKERLLPLLRNRANVYLAGHEHMAQHLAPEDGVHFLITPSAGQGPRAVARSPRTLYAGSYYGFLVLEADAGSLKVTFVDASGTARYQAKM